jgi:hypothetical protein|tara:strand:+ start:277 stop:501 length:225 start_codon:yes stop_codon:yes gene_type:complete
MVMEETIHFVESPETSTLRLNTDAMSYLGGAFVEADDADIKLEILEMIKKHSDFVLATSDKIVSRSRVRMRPVK